MQARGCAPASRKPARKFYLTDTCRRLSARVIELANESDENPFFISKTLEADDTILK